MNDEFCTALIEKNNVKLSGIVNKFLGSEEIKNNPDNNFLLIKNWIEKHECVVKAETYSTLIDTEPPVKEFAVYLAGIPKPFTIGIKLFPDQMKFDMK